MALPLQSRLAGRDMAASDFLAAAQVSMANGNNDSSSDSSDVTDDVGNEHAPPSLPKAIKLWWEAAETRFGNEQVCGATQTLPHIQY